MKLNTILFVAAWVFFFPLQASNVFKIGEHPLSPTQCALTMTSNPLDLSLRTSGYFIVSKGKKGSEKLFTRYGRVLLDANYFVRSESGDYLMKIANKENPKRMSKIKISTKDLAPKASNQIKFAINVNANASSDREYSANTVIYDSVSNQHTISTTIAKSGRNTWRIRIVAGKTTLQVGKLEFDNQGKLIKQEGLSHIEWPTDYGMNELKVDFSESTQYAAPFSIRHITNNGYPLGRLAGLSVDLDGYITLLYDNGLARRVGGRIAVAKFINPNHLESIGNHLYKPTEKSGAPMIHWINGNYSVISGTLEEDPC